jgi:hypothetical protein
MLNSLVLYKNKKLLLIVFIILLSYLNLFYYIYNVADPLIRADDWHYLYKYIINWETRGLKLSDLYGARGLFDHAQPLHKFVLFINYKLFGLDYRLFSYFALFFLFLFAVIILRLYLKTNYNKKLNFFSLLFLLFSFSILFSLNQSSTAGWPLAAFNGYFALLFIAICSILLWQILIDSKNKKNFFYIFLIFILILLGNDTRSLMFLLTILSIIVTLSFKEYYRKKINYFYVFIFAIYVVTYFLIIKKNFIFNNNFTISPTQSLTNVNFIELILSLLKYVFGNSIINIKWLNNIALTYICGIIVFYFYIRYFYIFIFKKKIINSFEFVISVFLFYSSITITILLLTRISTFGIGYLNSPRYYIVYQLIPFALFLDYSLNHNINKRYKIIITFILTIFLIYTHYQNFNKGYKSIYWIKKYQFNQYIKIEEYINNPLKESGCNKPSDPVLCRYTIEQRNKMLSFLNKKKLNFMNEKFLIKYNFKTSIN